MRRIDTSISISAPPERVWHVLTDFSAYGEWNPFFIAVTGIAQSGMELSLRTKLFERSKPRDFKVTVRTANAPRELVWSGGLVLRGIMDGVHGFELDAVDGGTNVRHYEQLSGAAIPVLSPLVTKLEQRYFVLNDALKRRAEEVN